MHIYGQLHAKIYVFVGVAAKNMGFTCSPPAYLSLAPTSSSGGPLVHAALTNGVNYASGGAGILDSTVSS